MDYLLIILVLLLAGSLYYSVRVYQLVNYYEDFIVELYQMYDLVDKQITMIDMKQSFENDDETGVIYRGIKDSIKLIESTFNEQKNINFTKESEKEKEEEKE